MTDTKEMLKKIAALRVRLDQAQNKVAVATAPQQTGGQEINATTVLEEKVRTGARHNALLDDSLRQIAGAPAFQLPPKLTARGAQVLKRGRELLHQLREMLEDPLLQSAGQDPLTGVHADIASMLDVLLRTVQAFPPSASAQLRLCEGLEAAERLIEGRLTVLNAALTQRRASASRTTPGTDRSR